MAVRLLLAQGEQQSCWHVFPLTAKIGGMWQLYRVLQFLFSLLLPVVRLTDTYIERLGKEKV